MKTIQSIRQIEYQLARARRAYQRALNGSDAAAIERLSDRVGGLEVDLRVARGANFMDALNATFGPLVT